MAYARTTAVLLFAAFRLTASAVGVTSPEEFLGYELGQRFTRHHQVVRYLEHLAETSPLVRVEPYGETVEHRPLIRVVITSEANHEKLDTIRSRISELQNPGETSLERARELAKGTPAIVLLSFGVHGDESSSTEAAMKLAHHLASSSEIATVLDTLVVVIDPLQNPDGREQYLQFYQQAVGSKPDKSPDSFEHKPPWRSGRTSHYYVDMNRDWIWGTQQETVARIRQFREWRPQVFVDFHEMTARDAEYFFPPAAAPVNPNMPTATVGWLETFGRANASAFSEREWPFYVGETYDLFYPGYGDSWPSLRGTIGMTYEVAGNRGAGKVVERPDGREWTLADRIERHFVTGLTTLRTASEHREGLLLHNYDSLASNYKGTATVYLFNARDPSARFATEILDLQGIEFERVDEEQSMEARNVMSGQSETRAFADGTFVVSTRQPLGGLVRTLFERSPAIEPSFVEEQKERVKAEESDQFYDITAWSLPVSLNLDVWEVSNGRKLRLRPDDGMKNEAPVAAKLGWAISGSEASLFRAVGHLLSSSVRFSVASAPVTIGDQTLPRGSVVVFRTNNDEDLETRFVAAVSESDVRTVPIEKFWTRGISLGSEKIQYVDDPKIALLAGDGVNPYSFGPIWHQLDVRDAVPHTVISARNLGDTDLRKFRVIVMPDGEYESFGNAEGEKLKAWVEAGGVLAAIKRASAFLRDGEIAISEITEWGAKDEVGKEEKKAKHPPLPGVPGAAFHTEIRERSWLTMGVTRPPLVLINGDVVLEMPEHEVTSIVTITSENALAAGFAWPESVEALSGSPWLVVEKVGRGKVITFADEPNFRLFWRGTYPLFMNAILYGPSFD